MWQSATLGVLWLGLVMMIVVCAIVAQRQPVLRRTLGGELTGYRLPINHASQSQLRALPGVGPALAHRIVEHRQRVDRFTHMQQLEDVPLIGPVTRQRIAPWITLD